MTQLEILKQCETNINDYFSRNAKEVYNAIIGAVDESDDLQAAAWKMAIASAEYSCKVSVMTTVSLLISLGVIDCDSIEKPLPLFPLVLPS